MNFMHSKQPIKFSVIFKRLKTTTRTLCADAVSHSHPRPARMVLAPCCSLTSQEPAKRRGSKPLPPMVTHGAHPVTQRNLIVEVRGEFIPVYNPLCCLRPSVSCQLAADSDRQPNARCNPHPSLQTGMHIKKNGNTNC